MEIEPIPYVLPPGIEQEVDNKQIITETKTNNLCLKVSDLGWRFKSSI